MQRFLVILTIMDKQVLKQILRDNQQEVVRYVIEPREITLAEFPCCVLVGVRRSGKSYMLYHQIQQLLREGRQWNEMLYLNFEDERLEGFGTEDFNRLLECHQEMYGKRPMLFLDEIQNIEHWEKFARRLANEKYRVYITGSNAKMLSSEVATTLGGRYVIQEVYPYSFSEYLRANNIALEKNWEYDSQTANAVFRAFADYFTYGGFPESVNIVQKRQWLSSLYQKIFLGDLIARYKIRNDFSLKLLVKKLSESIKQSSSFNRLANIVSSAGQKIQTSTIIEYVRYMEETWLLFGISNFAAKFAEKESARKYYFRDNGILNLFLTDPETSLLENRVAIELKKLYGDEVYFYNKAVEVDFYLPEQNHLIQVSYSIAEEETREREISALLKVSKHLKADKLTIITYNEEETLRIDNKVIEVIPLWRWLLL